MYLILFSFAAACAYRLGGWGDEGRKRLPKLPEWVFNTKVRDCGVPTIIVVYMYVSGDYRHILILCWGLLFASQTTYNKWAHKFFLKDNSNDVKWIDWIFTGLAYSVALLPYSLVIGNIPGFLHRSIIVTLFTFLWSEAIGNDVLEESGRGWIQVITLPLL